MYANIEIYRGDDNIYITRCPELDLYAKGNTQKEAVLKLKRKIAKALNKSNSLIDAKKEIDYTINYYSTRFPRPH